MAGSFCCGCFRLLNSKIAATATAIIATPAPTIHMGKVSSGGTVTVIVSVAMLPAESVTFSVIVYVPGIAKV